MTLGKRIMENRKRLGLTQDALAEQLGVTAQAVSKWENDQSCPDIATLPKLADLFGVSVDTLLGHETQTVHTAEVVDEAEEANGDGHTSKGGWEFRWDSGRRDAVFFAVFILLVGGLTLAAKLLQWNASFWDILWPCALLTIGLHRIFHRFSFFGIGCTLFGGYFLLENLEITKLNLAGDLIFPILIVIFGLSLLADALRKPKKPKIKITRNGHAASSKEKHHFSQDNDTFDCSLSFGDNEHLITLPCLAGGKANCSFGELRIDLSGCETIAESCQIDASCSFGQLVFRVPGRYRVKNNAGTAFGNISIKGQPDADPEGIIRLDGSANFGEIEIQYV